MIFFMIQLFFLFVRLLFLQPTHPKETFILFIKILFIFPNLIGF